MILQSSSARQKTLAQMPPDLNQPIVIFGQLLEVNYLHWADYPLIRMRMTRSMKRHNVRLIAFGNWPVMKRPKPIRFNLLSRNGAGPRNRKCWNQMEFMCSSLETKYTTGWAHRSPFPSVAQQSNWLSDCGKSLNEGTTGMISLLQVFWVLERLSVETTTTWSFKVIREIMIYQLLVHMLHLQVTMIFSKS